MISTTLYEPGERVARRSFATREEFVTYASEFIRLRRDCSSAAAKNEAENQPRSGEICIAAWGRNYKLTWTDFGDEP